MPSSSRRPYLIRAIYEWAVDNNMTPHILVAADEPGVEMPRDTMREGKVALNIAPAAVQGLLIGDELVSFSARFSGRSFGVQVPSRAVLAVYAKENGEGVVFGDVEPPDDPMDEPPPEADKSRPHLRVVK